MTADQKPATCLGIATDVIVAELTTRHLGPITPGLPEGRIGVGAAPGFNLIVREAVKSGSGIIKLEWWASDPECSDSAWVRVGIDNLAEVCREIADAAWASGLVTAETRRAAIVEFARSRLPEGQGAILHPYGQDNDDFHARLHGDKIVIRFYLAEDLAIIDHPGACGVSVDIARGYAAALLSAVWFGWAVEDFSRGLASQEGRGDEHCKSVCRRNVERGQPPYHAPSDGTVG